MEGLKDKHHHVFFDNYFTSFRLLEDLEKDGIYGCGTAHKDRKEFPAALKNPGLKERLKVAVLLYYVDTHYIITNNNRGESKTLQRGKVTASSWMDNKVVTVMSCPPHHSQQ